MPGWTLACVFCRLHAMGSADSPLVRQLLEAVETDLIYLNNHLW